MLFKRKKHGTLTDVIKKTGEYASRGYGDFGVFPTWNPEFKTYYTITPDGKIVELFEITTVGEGKFNHFKDKKKAEEALSKLEEAAKLNDYGDKKGGEFWFISPDDVTNIVYCSWDIEGMKRIGNCFDTEEEAREKRAELERKWYAGE